MFHNPAETFDPDEDFVPQAESRNDGQESRTHESLTNGLDMGNLMTMYLRDVRRFRPLDAQTESALFARIANDSDDGRQAREELICHHLGLVIALARKFNNRGLELLDLIEEGNLALLVALDKFEPERGLRFSTYAVWWIRYYLQTAIATQVPIVRPPLRAQRRAHQAAWAQWCASHGRTPSGEPAETTDTAAAGDMTGAGAEQDAQAPAAVGNAAPLVTSLALHADDIEAHFADADLCHPDVAHQAAENLDTPRIASLLRRLVAELPQRQRDLVIARFGLNGEEECTLHDLGVEQGVSRERMRQVQVSALDALRQGLERSGMTRATVLA